MCFSTPVSFVASAALTVVGLGALSKARSKQELPLALIPVLFAVQQFIEGLLWLALPSDALHLEQYWLTQSYALFVGMVWPTLIPLSLLLIEPDAEKKGFIRIILGVGALAAFYTLSVILRYGVSADITNACIVYKYPGDDMPGILAVYLVATCAAYFFSSYRTIRWIGAANLIGFLVAYYFYRLNYASVWCFFAALTSSLIYWHFARQPQSLNYCEKRAEGYDA